MKLCPKCKRKVFIEWEVIAGMRLRHTDEKTGKRHYNARCPECLHTFRVPAK